MSEWKHLEPVRLEGTVYDVETGERLHLQGPATVYGSNPEHKGEGRGQCVCIRDTVSGQTFSVPARALRKV